MYVCYFTDVNECLFGNGGCDHICTNSQGSFNCSCNPSYTLGADNQTCVLNSTGCDYVLVKPSGEIHTSGFPDSPYVSNSSCTWIINLRKYKRIKLTFDEIDIEDSPNCTKDRLIVLNGKGEDSLPLGNYCGNKLPATIKSSAEVITIKFLSDETVNNKGFTLHYMGLRGRSKGNHVNIEFLLTNLHVHNLQAYMDVTL